MRLAATAARTHSGHILGSAVLAEARSPFIGRASVVCGSGPDLICSRGPRAE